MAQVPTSLLGYGAFFKDPDGQNAVCFKLPTGEFFVYFFDEGNMSALVSHEFEDMMEWVPEYINSSAGIRSSWQDHLEQAANNMELSTASRIQN